jgi:hypothetical protein
VSLARRQGHDRVRLHVQDTISNPVAPAISTPIAVEADEKAPEAVEVEDVIADVTNEDPNTETEKKQKKSKRRSMSKRESLTTDEESDASDEESKQRRRSKRGEKRGIAEEYGLPIPDDLLLPAAVTFLGVVIATVFTISKLTASSSKY